MCLQSSVLKEVEDRGPGHTGVQSRVQFRALVMSEACKWPGSVLEWEGDDGFWTRGAEAGLIREGTVPLSHLQSADNDPVSRPHLLSGGDLKLFYMQSCILKTASIEVSLGWGVGSIFKDTTATVWREGRGNSYVSHHRGWWGHCQLGLNPPPGKRTHVPFDRLAGVSMERTLL